MGKPATRLKVAYKNQSAFESSSESCLLDRSKEPLWKSYRAAYADILSMWDLPVQQAEVMKIGTVANDTENMPLSQYLSSQSSKMSALPEAPSEETVHGPEGLDFQRHCAGCGHPLKTSIFAPTPVVPDTPSNPHNQSKSRRCSNCNPRQPLPTKLPCVICGEVVDGMLVPCLSCGHVSCFDCHRHWFLPNPSDKSDNTPPSCPTGCGCNCSDHVAIEVPMPQWEPISPRPGASPSGPGRAISQEKRHRRRQSEPPGNNNTSRNASSTRVRSGQHEDELDIWQTSSPFASLARGMGGGLSQGLRSKEDGRKKNRSIAITTPHTKRR